MVYCGHVNSVNVKQYKKCNYYLGRDLIPCNTMITFFAWGYVFGKYLHWPHVNVSVIFFQHVSANAWRLRNVISCSASKLDTI
jgi:hypothetical protein